MLAAELEGFGARKVRQGRGGVHFLANLDEAMRILVQTRIAMRVMYPLLEAEAHGADGLYDAVGSIAWEEWLDARSTFAVEATLRESEHTHSGFVALKAKDAIVDRLRRVRGSRPDVDTHNPDVQVVVYLSKTLLSVSLDLCGEPLFKRGYRLESTTAPMKETLAAAMLLSLGYDGSEPLVDPMCGSGTLAIEAGYLATRRAPGLKRSFGVERWPGLGTQAKKILETAKREAHALIVPAKEPIIARDRDPDALAATRRNVVAAGLSTVVRIEEADATRAPPPECRPGLVISNPPYGDRLTAGGQKGMKTFYYQLGEAFSRWPHWRLAFLDGNGAFESAFHHRPNKRVTLHNGPIECTLIGYPQVGGPIATPVVEPAPKPAE